ncbi:DNA primase family protein [Methylobacter sp. sgz302048]|uniref:DNA primase family protein n=1 Tax=Methylobacter sp. sgz302048 TaxID=3455945 RepID=UPI003F9F0EF0
MNDLDFEKSGGANRLINPLLDDEQQIYEVSNDRAHRAPSALARPPTDIDRASLSKNALSDDVDDESNSDTGSEKDSILAARLATVLKNVLCFDDVSGDWHLQQSGVWRPVSKKRAVKIISRSLYGALPHGFSMSKLNSMEAFLTIHLLLDGWQADKNLLPLKNGILNIQTKELVPYTHRHRLNWQLPYDYDSSAKIKVIKEWLSDATGNDAEAISIIRAFFRMALVGGDVQKFLELIGPGGTGKSTLIRLFESFIGKQNQATTDLKNLENNRFEVANIYGKKLVVINDSARYGGEVPTLKAITGGDPVRHEKKNQQQGESFIYAGVVVIAANEPIQSSDYTSGLIRRRMPVPFRRKITDEDKAKWASVGGIETAMKSELAGLLNWVLEMTDDEMRAAIGGINGGMTKAQREHLISTNKIAAWLDDNVVIDSQAITYIGVSTTKETDADIRQELINEKLYSNYERWCYESNAHPIAQNRFTDNLADVCEQIKIPVEKGRNKQGRFIKGLAIRRDWHTDKTPVTKADINDSALSNDKSALSVLYQTRASAEGALCVGKNLSVKKHDNKERF